MAYRGRHINPQRFERGQIKILLILLPLALFMALPIVFIVNHAFKPMEELFAFPPTFFVRNPTLDNFTKLIKFSRSAGIPLTRYLFNSLIVAGDTLLPHRASVISSTRRTETPARYISISASSTLLSLRR